jgi:hypothetical protein
MFSSGNLFYCIEAELSDDLRTISRCLILPKRCPAEFLGNIVAKLLLHGGKIGVAVGDAHRKIGGQGGGGVLGGGSEAVRKPAVEMFV